MMFDHHFRDPIERRESESVIAWLLDANDPDVPDTGEGYLVTRIGVATALPIEKETKT